MNLKDLREIAEAATPGPWFKVGSSIAYQLAPNTTDALAFSYRPKNQKHIATFNPHLMLKILDVVEAATQTEKLFMGINDGFFTGLVPPEFGVISMSLRELNRELEKK